jgi:hypothetical protein
MYYVKVIKDRYKMLQDFYIKILTGNKNYYLRFKCYRIQINNTIKSWDQ